MKKVLMSGLFLLVFFSVSTTTLGAPSVSFGPGVGIPYGVIGCNLEVDFFEYFGICAGVGISPEGIGSAIGGRIYLAGADTRVRPRLGYYRGTVGAVEYAWDEYEDVRGNAIGLGFLTKINDKISMDGEIIYIESWEYTKEEPDSRYKISVGVRFSF